MAFLEVDGLSKTYRGEAAPVVRDLSFALDAGRIMVLLGASGCGKTTILKLIAGLEAPDAGTVAIDGAPMEGLAPERRPVAMVFQKALLFNHMTVAQNVSFAPRVNRTMRKDVLARRTDEMLELVGLAGMGGKRATELSGGQEQRVSLARALMVAPKLLLLDEPLSALDAALRENMQAQIRAVRDATGVTMLVVTHDQQEAIALADYVAVMHGGEILQMAPPAEFYARPATRYVASFFGWKNFVPGTQAGGRVTCALGEFALEGLPGDAPTTGVLAVRPEAAVNVGGGRLRAVVRRATYAGMSTRYEVTCGDVPLLLALPARERFAEGDEIAFDLDPASVWYVRDDGEDAAE